MPENKGDLDFNTFLIKTFDRQVVCDKLRQQILLFIDVQMYSLCFWCMSVGCTHNEPDKQAINQGSKVQRFKGSNHSFML